jgi:hypothetical protein
MGKISMTAVAPNGQLSILLPRRLFPIVESQAELEGLNLGHPSRVEVNPSIGNINLPTRPIFAEGKTYFQIKDPEDYQRLRRELGRIKV